MCFAPSFSGKFARRSRVGAHPQEQLEMQTMRLDCGRFGQCRASSQQAPVPAQAQVHFQLCTEISTGVVTSAGSSPGTGTRTGIRTGTGSIFCSATRICAGARTGTGANTSGSVCVGPTICTAPMQVLAPAQFQASGQAFACVLVRICAQVRVPARAPVQVRVPPILQVSPPEIVPARVFRTSARCQPSAGSSVGADMVIEGGLVQVPVVAEVLVRVQVPVQI